jgi:hypothetical protein
MKPWQPLLDWWFGADGGSATEVAAARQGLWFGKLEQQRWQAGCTTGPASRRGGWPC